MINLNELRKLTVEDLVKRFNELDKEISMDKFNIESRRNNKTALLRGKKKDLARIATVINELKIIKNLNNENRE